jgi:ApbE superfamily uncharacterized protein (UPF0280 family)
MNIHSSYILLLVISVHILVLIHAQDESIHMNSKILKQQEIHTTLRTEGEGSIRDAAHIVHRKRTATGGYVNKTLSFLTIVAFVGNFSFAVHVFWFSRFTR